MSSYFRNKSPFYTPSVPVKSVFDHKTRTWFLVDNDNVIFTESLTKETANVIVSSMNYIDETLELLKVLYEHEDVVFYRKEGDTSKSKQRDQLIRVQYEMLRDFGIDVKWHGAQDYHKNLWKHFADIIETHRQELKHTRRLPADDPSRRNKHSNSE